MVQRAVCENLRKLDRIGEFAWRAESRTSLQPLLVRLVVTSQKNLYERAACQDGHLLDFVEPLSVRRTLGSQSIGQDHVLTSGEPFPKFNSEHRTNLVKVAVAAKLMSKQNGIDDEMTIEQTRSEVGRKQAGDRELSRSRHTVEMNDHTGPFAIKGLEPGHPYPNFALK